MMGYLEPQPSMALPTRSKAALMQRSKGYALSKTKELGTWL
jgi:hypothetical protein